MDLTDGSESDTASQARYQSVGGGLDLDYYLSVLKRRIFWFLIPFVLVLSIGCAIVMILKPVYLAESRLLVELQQIPTELVRPTVTASAKERIQVIEQRVMTRENLLAIADKFRVFPEQRQKMSSTELLDLMRLRIRLQPFELDQTRRRNDALTIALTIAFEYEDPPTAMRVANELMTLILSEDARNRTSRAHETTAFLAKELKKLETDLGTIEAQIADHKRRNVSEPVSEKATLQLMALKAELQEKSAVFSPKHPDIVRLARQIAGLEAMTKRAAQDENGLEVLQNQRTTIQKNIEATTQKVAAARLGESLETGQFAERLQVLENAILPQKPIKPNRPKLLALVLALAFAAGGAAVVMVESLNSTLRDPRDLLGLVDAHMLVTIPYIATAKERVQKKVKAVMAASFATASCIAGLAGVHLLWKPLDEVWTICLAARVGVSAGEQPQEMVAEIGNRWTRLFKRSSGPRREETP